MFATIVGRILGAIGLFALGLYGLLAFFLPELAGKSWVGATGAVGVAARVYLDWDALAGFFGSRGGQEQLVSWALVLLVFVGCGFTMHLSRDWGWRLDLSEGRVHSLDAKTEEILEGIPDDVEVDVIGFFVNSYDQMEAGKYRAFERLVDAGKATGTSARLELVDPETSPLMASQLGVTSNGTVVITARPKDGGPERTERLYSPDEQELANALLRVVGGERAKVVFLEGHGERTPSTSGDRGIRMLSQRLRDLGFETGTWKSVTEPEPPAGMNVLVVAGPTQALDVREASAIRQWVEDGGALMLLAEPPLDGVRDGKTGLEGALLSWGFDLRDDLVLDPLMEFGGDAAAPIVDSFGYHEITKDFDLPVVFVTARSVAEQNELPEQVSTFALAKTGDSAWGETELDAEEGVDFSEDADHAGPITLVGLAELHRQDGEGGGRVIVAGDVDWVSDGLVVSRGNLDFASRAIGWLAAEDDVVELPPKESSSTTMELSLLQSILLWFVSLALAPGAVAVSGMIIWVWRRGL